MSEALSQARQVLEDRLRELKAEVTQIERALTRLGPSDRQRPAQRRPPASRRASANRERVSRRRRMPREEREAALAQYARENPEATNAQIAMALGVGSPYVSQLINTSDKVRRDASGTLIVKR